MQIPDEVLDLGLKPSEFYLLAILYRNVDRWGEIHLTMEQLTALTGSSRTTVWRDMSGLEEKGLVDTYRSKRNLGKYHKNQYKIVAPCFKSETEVEPGFKSETLEVESRELVLSPCFKNETSTAVLDSNVVNQVSTSKVIVKDTSYLLRADGPNGALKEFKVVNKWQDDDDIGGFGLLENEVPAGQRVKPMSKRDPKTRHLRPEAEWTAMDVASEFAVRVYDKVRGIPGLVNTRQLGGALSANRSKFGVTAVLEMELLDKFFADERNIAMVKKLPNKCHGMFLNFITANINSVVEDLGMDEVEVQVDKPSRPEYIYASDGKKFGNSMPGRKSLERYEEKLRRA